MGKRDEWASRLSPIIGDADKLEEFVVTHSNLPGPRANLELAFALAEIYSNLEVLLRWADISEDEAGVNDPRAFLAFCAAVCLGEIYAKTKDPTLIDRLKRLANDGRWRMREAVAFGFQMIGEEDFGELRAMFSEWIEVANNLEKRAILVALAHPPFLNEVRVKFCFEITDVILAQLDEGEHFDILKKGLEFTISVFTAVNPSSGFQFIRKWIGQSKLIDKILEKNLRKNRLIKRNPEAVKQLLGEIQAHSEY